MSRKFSTARGADTSIPTVTALRVRLSSSSTSGTANTSPSGSPSVVHR